MKASQLQDFLKFAITKNFPVMISGAPGIGKSDIVSSAAAAAGCELIISHPVVADPTDFKGAPYVKDGEAEFIPFSDLKKLIDAKVPTVFFLDDLGQAPASVQAAAMQLLLAREVNGHKISDHVRFLAATNRREDKAGVQGILEPVKSRFATIIELEVDTNDWCKWALDNDLPIELISFIRFRPNQLSAFKATRDMKNSPCPRTVASVGKMFNEGLGGMSSEVQYEVVAGAVGEGFASEYMGFLKIFKSLPNLDAIILNPDTVDVPSEPATLYAVCGALSRKVTDNNADNIFKWMEKVSAEFQVLFVKDAVTVNPSITDTKAFTKWAVNNSHVSL